jgi:hypothetical protein
VTFDSCHIKQRPCIFPMLHVQATLADCVWNVMAHAQEPDFVFQRDGRVHLYRRGHQFSWLLAAEVCASAVVMLDTPCSKVVWRVLATHSIRQFPLHFPSCASPCAITFQLDSTAWGRQHDETGLVIYVGGLHCLLTSCNADVSKHQTRWDKVNALCYEYIKKWQ